ncbi:hypothetical protein HYV85_02160 [Candidatus Woesearchaeota archaeon]|nr:hypothetical protein [Candidatus Woesearchaeota archaeon]
MVDVALNAVFDIFCLPPQYMTQPIHALHFSQNARFLYTLSNVSSEPHLSHLIMPLFLSRLYFITFKYFLQQFQEECEQVGLGFIQPG